MLCLLEHAASSCAEQRYIAHTHRSCKEGPETSFSVEWSSGTNTRGKLSFNLQKICTTTLGHIQMRSSPHLVRLALTTTHTAFRHAVPHECFCLLVESNPPNVDENMVGSVWQLRGRPLLESSLGESPSRSRTRGMVSKRVGVVWLVICRRLVGCFGQWLGRITKDTGSVA